VRRPRLRAILAGAAALLAVLVAVAWLIPPLGPGNGGVAGGPPGSDQGTSPAGATIIGYVPSGRVAFGVEVRNTTFLPVIVEGLRFGPAGFLLEDSHLVLGTDPNIMGLEEGQVHPFEPVTLAPGEVRLLGVVGRFPDCANARPNWATGAGVTIDALRLSVRIAGLLPADSDVPLLRPVDLLGDADAACG
jgi:hypothetical protein